MFMRTTLAAASVIALATAASAKPVTVSAETNLRAAPGTKSEVLTLMPKGSEVDIGECDAGWCQVKFGDKEGFAIARNLGQAPVTTGSTSRAQPQTQADMQRLRRGYEQYFDGDAQNDQSSDMPTQRSYSQRNQQYNDDGRNDQAADIPAQRRSAQRTQPRTEYYDDDDDAPAVVYGRPAYVPGPPVYYSYYYPFPRQYYYGPRVYYRRW